MNNLREIKLEEMNIDPFKDFRNGALVTAYSNGKHNTMTIGWGGLGVLWRKNVATVYIRENRYTYEFIEKAKSLVAEKEKELGRKLTFCN